MSRRMEDLHPLVRPLCLRHMALFEERYPEFLLVLSFTFRSFLEQDELFYRGRNSSGRVVDKSKVVTYARGGQSWHNVMRDEETPASLAYDLLIYDEVRKVLPGNRAAWQDLGSMGMSLGLDWGVVNDEGSRWDLGHFYLTGKNHITLAEANSGIDPVV